MTVKAAIVFKRKPGMALDAFRSYWLDEHPKAVLKMPGLVRYCQNHPLPGGYRKGELACDGVAETWWTDMETLRRNAALPAFRELCEDEARFIDRAGMATLLVEEHVIIDGPRPEGGVKTSSLCGASPAWRSARFQDYCAASTAPSPPGLRSSAAMSRTMSASAPTGRAGSRRWTASPSPGSTTPTPCAPPPPRTPMRPRAPMRAAFIDRARLAFVVTKEHVIKG